MSGHKNNYAVMALTLMLIAVAIAWGCFSCKYVL